MYSPHQSSSFRIKQNTGMDLSARKEAQSWDSIVLFVAGNDRTGGERAFLLVNSLSIGLIHLGASFNC